MSESRPGKGRLILLLIIAVFAIPMIAAYLYRPSGEPGNHGTLVDPPRPLQEFRMTGVDGEPAGLETVKDKWTLLYIGGDNCGERCRAQLFNIERVRLTQGKHMDRVQSLYLAPASMTAREVSDTLVEYKDVKGYRISRSGLGAMAPGFDRGDAAGRIYVVDPLGNLMMFYPEDADPTGMKKDLDRLLKVSQIG